MHYDAFDKIENLSKEGEFVSYAEPLYFKNWLLPDFDKGLSLDQKFRASEGPSRGFPHKEVSLRHILSGLKAGWMRHPKAEEILAVCGPILPI